MTVKSAVLFSATHSFVKELLTGHQGWHSIVNNANLDKIIIPLKDNAMKNKWFFNKIILFVFGTFTLLTLAECSSSKGYGNSTGRQYKSPPTHDPSVINPNEERTSSLQFSDMLRQVPGVEVRGDGFSATVRIRGAQSLMLTTEPLYVLDGVPMGRSFASVSRTINPMHIKRIKVLKGADATMYGARGSNGIIEITLKKE